MSKLNNTTQRWIWNTWRQYPPEWFVTILWNDMPTSPITCTSHTSKLRNLFLCEVTGKKKSGHLADFPNRLGITSFQERTISDNGKIIYHTHWHIYNSASGSAIITDPHEGLWQNWAQLHFLLRYKVGNRIQKLLKTTKKGNEGIVVKRWSEEFHLDYNMKEWKQKRYEFFHQYTQDKDLLIDYENSDVLPL
jgi:hypothetical protein